MACSFICAAAPISTRAPLTERLLFWPTTLLACFAIPAGIQVKLGVTTWLTTHHEDILRLVTAQGMLNLGVPLIALLVRRR